MKNKTIRAIISISLNVLLVIVAVYIIFSAGSRAYTFGMRIFNEQAVDTEADARTVEVTIKDNISAKELAKALYDKGLIKDKTIFYFQVQLSDYKGKFAGGTYTLTSDMKPSEMMGVMAPSSDNTDSTEE